MPRLSTISLSGGEAEKANNVSPGTDVGTDVTHQETRRPVVMPQPSYAPPSSASSFMSLYCSPVCHFSLSPQQGCHVPHCCIGSCDMGAGLGSEMFGWIVLLASIQPCQAG